MYDAALQRVAQTNSDLQDLQTGLDYQRIVAPFDGVVTSVPVDVGTFVSPGQPVVSLENPSRYQVVFSLEEGLLHAVQTNQNIFISIPVISPNQLAAQIDQVSTTIDAHTRTFQVKANLPPEPGLRSGLSAKIFLSTEMGHSLWIPQEFLKQKDDIETVLVKEQNRWRRILVKSGDHKNGNVEILSGLNEGELVGLQENP